MLDAITQTIRAALEAAYLEHEALGQAGQEVGLINQFGDSALRLDIACEQRIFECLRQSGLSIRIVSEELGTKDLVDTPQMLAVLDGLDGSNVYLTQRGKAHYGTMLGVSSNLDPTYQDSLVAGIIEHSPKRRLLISVAGQPALLEEDGNSCTVHTSGCETLDKSKPILSAWESMWAGGLPTAKLSGFDLQSFGSMAAAFMRLATGEIDVILDITRKNNLEQMIAFGIVRAAGGEAVTPDGESIAQQRYLGFGRDDLKRVPIIWAATPELACQIARICFD